MTYQEEKQMKLRRQGSKHAIAMAIQGRWREAVEVNKNIVENFPQDTDAYNRLGKAYLELGDYAQAEEAYKRAVELDSFNVIAKKNLSRLPYFSKAAADSHGEMSKAEPQHFIEETGKSRMFNLYRPAPGETLARIVAGDTVNLKVDGSTLVIEDSRGTYLGMVEPRYGHRLVQLINGGNRYSAAVVGSSSGAVSVIIREVYQSPAQVGLLAFPGRRYEEVATYASDKVFKDSTEYGGGWGGAGEYALEGEAEVVEEAEDSGEDKAEHEV
jgi:tetratricopeptide (TPR) repeat protein